MAGLSGRLGRGPNGVGIGIHQGAADIARLEAIGPDLGNRRHFRRRADDEALVEGLEFLRHDPALDHIEALFLGERDHRLAGDAVEEAVGQWRVKGAVAGEEDVGARAFGDAALPVEHHGVGIALLLGPVLGERADHVEAGGLRNPSAQDCEYRPLSTARRQSGILVDVHPIFPWN